MKKLVFISLFIPVLSFAQDSEPIELKYYNMYRCYCSRPIKGDSTTVSNAIRKQQNFSPYKYDDSKPNFIELDSTQAKPFNELLLNEYPMFISTPADEEKKKPT